jgi:hypothetical protein
VAAVVTVAFCEVHLPISLFPGYQMKKMQKKNENEKMEMKNKM